MSNQEKLRVLETMRDELQAMRNALREPLANATSDELAMLLYPLSLAITEVSARIGIVRFSIKLETFSEPRLISGGTSPSKTLIKASDNGTRE